MSEIVKEHYKSIIVDEFIDTSAESNLKQRIEWALTKPDKIVKVAGVKMSVLKKEAEKKEKEWGNSMIGQLNNGQWTTLLGEKLVYDVLALRGENPRKVEKKNGFLPDWETDEYMYEVKTSNWWVSGTAGEKVLGTWIKYQSIPELYGKPLREERSHHLKIVRDNFPFLVEFLRELFV